MYRDWIREELAALGLVGRYAPHHIEAWMRTEHPTLDGLSKAQFRAEVALAAACIDEAGAAMSEDVAQSHGLRP